MKEKVYFQWFCRKNYVEFYSLHILLKCLAALEREKINLENKTKNIYTRKMESKYGKITESQFDEKTKRFKSREELYYFILNVLNLISH